jgi:hypothetical protein
LLDLGILRGICVIFSKKFYPADLPSPPYFGDSTADTISSSDYKM